MINSILMGSENLIISQNKKNKLKNWRIIRISLLKKRYNYYYQLLIITFKWKINKKKQKMLNSCYKFIVLFYLNFPAFKFEIKNFEIREWSKKNVWKELFR